VTAGGRLPSDSGMKAMRPVTRDDVIKAVGPIDDVAIAEIIATGPTPDELADRPGSPMTSR
jgi:hypothetical protein